MSVGKRKVLIAAALLALGLIIYAGTLLARGSFTYTNLAAPDDCELARTLLDGAGITPENTERLLELVEEFYSVPYPSIDGGFERAYIQFFRYSGEDAAQHLDMQPDAYLTCRMAAFILLRDKITFPDSTQRPPTLEEKDHKSRRNLTDSGDLLHYDLLFANLERTVRSSAELSAAVTEHWEESGIVFPVGEKAGIVTAYGSNGEGVQNFHTAVAVYSGDELWLLEKYDPIYPWQLSRFKDEAQLVRYLETRVSDAKYAAIFLGGSCLWTK